MHKIDIRARPYRSVAAQDEDDPAKRVEFCEAFLQEAQEWWEKHKKWICPQGTEAHEPFGGDEVFVRNTVWYDAHKSPSDSRVSGEAGHSQCRCSPAFVFAFGPRIGTDRSLPWGMEMHALLTAGLGREAGEEA